MLRRYCCIVFRPSRALSPATGQNLLNNTQSHEQFGIPMFPMLRTIKRFFSLSLRPFVWSVCLFRLILPLGSNLFRCVFRIERRVRGVHCTLHSMLSLYAPVRVCATWPFPFNPPNSLPSMCCTRYNRFSLSVYFRLWPFSQELTIFAVNKLRFGTYFI